MAAMLLVMGFCGICQGQQGQKLAFSTEPLEITVSDAKMTTYPDPDSSDGKILVYTGQIAARQKWPDDAVMEFRAQNAVFFFNKQAVDSLLSNKDNKTAPDRQLGVYLQGDVRMHLDKAGVKNFKTVDNEISADEVYVDLITGQATIINAKLRMAMPDTHMPIYVRAQKIKMLSQKDFEIYDAKLSNDEFYEPWFSLGIKHLLVDSDAEVNNPAATAAQRVQMEMKGISAKIEGVPISWWPKASGDASTANMPLKSLSLGSDSEFGACIEAQWDLNWLTGANPDSNVQSFLRTDGFSERGGGIGIDADYKNAKYGADNSFGQFRSYMVYDEGYDRLGRLSSRRDVTPPNDLRGWAQWRHRQYLRGDWQVTLEGAYISDRNFLESWREKEFDTDKEPETLIYFKQQRHNWAVDLTAKWHLNDFQYDLTEMPKVGLHLAGQDLGIFTYYQDGYIGRFAQRAGDRLVAGPGPNEIASTFPDSLNQDYFTYGLSRHELALPLNVGRLKFIPTAIGTYAYDDMADEDVWQGAIGFRSSMQFWKVDDSVHSELFDIDRLRHIVRPELNIFAVDSDQAGDDARDILNFGVRQTFQTKRGPAGKKRSVDFLRFNTSATFVTNDQDNIAYPNYFLASTPENQFDLTRFLNDDLDGLGLTRAAVINQTVSDFLEANWLWQISDTAAMDGDVNYNLNDDVLSKVAAGFAINHSPRTRYYLGYRFYRRADVLEDRDTQLATGRINYKMNRKYSMGLSQQYNIVRDAPSYTRATLIRKNNRWYSALSFGYDPVRSGFSFTVSFWPAGYDKLTIGTRRAANAL
ncbi:MAG: hypothetical protein JEZ07_13565 [Phycisphaerae bacterium]|nr:hypothetical protein [Phycisphaerae bacterium]